MGAIIRTATAGTFESSDAYVEVGPGRGSIDLSLESVVEQQFGEAIRRAVREVLSECGCDDIEIRIADRGALDCVIKARVEAAVRRGGMN